jgi:chromosome segregation ATPase
VIQSVLSFILGFLIAVALEIAAAPALWRRAGELMRRRMEATLPMSREEMRAEIDAVRAEHAMAMRRLEMKADAVKKRAAQDLVEIGVLREQARRLEEQHAERDEAVVILERERTDLGSRLAEREAELKRVTEEFNAFHNELRERNREVEELSRLYEEASLTSSSRQVELVSREADIERLNDSINLLRNQRKEADRATREALAEKTQTEEALRGERKRAADLERKLERMLTTLSNREEKLDRREKEIARLKQRIKEGPSAGGNDNSRLAAIEEEKSRLEMQVADLSLQLSSLLAGDDQAAAAPANKSEVSRLQSRLSTLMRENKKLRTELAASASAEGDAGDEALRERISSLAAEVVNLAATLEGPGSPIEKALAEAETAPEGERPPSLADRVKALRANSQAAE